MYNSRANFSIGYMINNLIDIYDVLLTITEDDGFFFGVCLILGPFYHECFIFGFSNRSVEDFFSMYSPSPFPENPQLKPTF